MTDAPPSAAQTSAFISRWRAAGGTERANYQLFIGELCALLDCPTPDPASDDTRDNAYVFERRVQFAHGDGSSSHGFIDCYRRGGFVLEAKKVKALGHTRGFDDALLRARAQAESYARALPAAEGRPPFLLVVDVGHVIEVYAEFSRSGATYTPFPDPRSHRIALADLHQPVVRERLRNIWLETRSRSTRRAAAPASRAKSRPNWRNSPPRSKPPATRRRPWPRSSPAACSACSPKTWRCCPNAASRTCWNATAKARPPCRTCCARCGPTWTAAASAPPLPATC